MKTSYKYEASASPGNGWIVEMISPEDRRTIARTLSKEDAKEFAWTLSRLAGMQALEGPLAGVYLTTTEVLAVRAIIDRLPSSVGERILQGAVGIASDMHKRATNGRLR